MKYGLSFIFEKLYYEKFNIKKAALRTNGLIHRTLKIKFGLIYVPCILTSAIISLGLIFILNFRKLHMLEPFFNIIGKSYCLITELSSENKFNTTICIC